MFRAAAAEMLDLCYFCNEATWQPPGLWSPLWSCVYRAYVMRRRGGVEMLFLFHSLSEEESLLQLKFVTGSNSITIYIISGNLIYRGIGYLYICQCSSYCRPPLDISSRI